MASCSESCSSFENNIKSEIRKRIVRKDEKQKDKMALYDIPNELLDKLKCALCYEYLSYPPITLYAETGSVCGRCPTLEAEKNVQPIRERSYEDVASILTFPCRYKPNGCTENATMQQIPIHEQSCLFKPYFCPILPLGSCAWQGSPTELHQHFAINHQIMLLDSPVFEMDIVNSYKEHYLVPYFEELFLLRTEFNCSDKIFRCVVHLVGKPEEAPFYEYEMLFSTSQDSEKTWTHPKKPVSSDVNLLDRIDECIVELPMLRAALEEPTVIVCKVQIIRTISGSTSKEEEEEEILLYSDEEVFEDLEESKQGSSKGSRSKILDDIECPVCQEYMISPIYQCVTGHSVCGVCKPQLKECPTCRGAIASTRNFTLEKIIENIEYQCKHNEDGCNFEGTSANIRKHELECKYRPNRCPLSEKLACDWLGLLNKSYAHAKSAHPNSIQTNSIYETTYNPSCSRFEEFKLKAELGQVFRIRYSYCNETQQVSCVVQKLAPSDDNKKFLYEINVMDCSKTGLELKSKKFCGSFSDSKDDIKYCTLWHLDMVKPFFGPNQVLKFKCIITKG